MQVAHLLRIVLLETHDRLECFQALLPVIIDCCSILADLARTSLEAFFAAVELLTALAAGGEFEGSALRTAFEAVAVDERVAAEAQALFCMLAATAAAFTGTFRETEPRDALAERLLSALQQSSMATAAAKAIGDGFVAAENSFSGSLLGSLVSVALQQEPRDDSRNVTRWQDLVTSENQLIEVPHKIRECALLQHVVLLAQVRFESCRSGRAVHVPLVFNPCSHDQPPRKGYPVSATIDLHYDDDDETLKVSCCLQHSNADVSPPAALMLIHRPGSMYDDTCTTHDAEALLATLLREPTALWERKVSSRDTSSSDGALIAGPSMLRGEGRSFAVLSDKQFQVEDGTCLYGENLIVVLGVPVCL